MVYSVVFTPEARAKPIALYRYIEIDASPPIAQRFTDAIVNRCEHDLITRPTQLQTLAAPTAMSHAA
jgi:plasmid stabilization system protein ParE